MKILLFGKNGQVGWELDRSLQPLADVVSLGREGADFSDPESLRELVREAEPDVIVNAAAYTAVDKAEEDEDVARLVNEVSAGVLAEEAARQRILMVHYSTDYVFDGKKADPYDEDDSPAPLNAYGHTKLAGEQAIRASGCNFLIFRTSWVYAARGHNFLLTMLRLAQERDELSVVSDQLGSPTSARLIADVTAHCLKQSLSERAEGKFESGLYHLTASGYTSWHGFTDEIIKLASNKPGFQSSIKELGAIPTSSYPTPAKRPMNSRLKLAKLETAFSLHMPDWKLALQLCLDDCRMR